MAGLPGVSVDVDFSAIADCLRIFSRLAEEISCALGDAATDLELLVPDDDVDTPRVVETVPPTSPDCAAGKCPACTGDAWDVGVDRLTDCRHHCHDKGAGDG
jgi:hypothetical protein